MQLTFGHETGHQPRHPGGNTLLIDMTAEERAALGDYSEVAMRLTGILRALAVARDIRNAGETADERRFAWNEIFTDIEKLLPMMHGLRAAAIRASVEHDKASLGDLALWMEVARSTAQDRRDAVLDNPPSQAERFVDGSMQREAVERITRRRAADENPGQRAGTVHGGMHQTIIWRAPGDGAV